MKTTVDIPRKELEEAMGYLNARTKREAIVAALVEFNRRRRLAALADKFGTFEHFLSHEELSRLRKDAQ